MRMGDCMHSCAYAVLNQEEAGIGMEIDLVAGLLRNTIGLT